MADLLKNSPVALRHCIRFEILQGTSIKEAYSKFCRTIGNDFMEYREFDFWYHQFLKGEYDSNFEKDKNKKIYELSDMPILVMEKIVGKLDIIDRSSLSRTSRSFHAFVGNQKTFVHTLKLEVSNHTTNVSFGKSVELQYIKEYAACRKIFKNRETRILRVAYWKQAVRDIEKILKNPKLHLDTLEIELKINKGALFNDLQKALTHHLNVKNLKLKEYSWRLLPKILPIMKPGYLSKINIHIYNPKVDSMNTLFEMEQWKQAKHFEMDFVCFIWPLHHLYHLKEFTVILERLSVENIRQIKEFLFKSPDFEKCSLTLYREIAKSIVAQEFGNALRKDPYIYHYPIPNSTEYFEIRVEGHRFKVTRKKK